MKKGFFSKIVVGWYSVHQRNLPWRSANDPYKIWLSEIILQQTRVIQGLPYYERFIKKFPTVDLLAAAPVSEVLRLWQGLGYYARGRHLHLCAKVIVKEHQSVFPREFEQLKKLPGIGDYTAAAVASIAFDQPVAVIDGNVYRVLSRVFGITNDITTSSGKAMFHKMANEQLDVEAPGTYNQAVMEFGALQCVPRNPLCESCVLRKVCFASMHSLQDAFPVKARKTKTRNRYLTYFLIRQGKKVYMRERKQNDIWKGLYDLPLLETVKTQTPRKSLTKFFGSEFSLNIRKTNTYKHVLTHQILHVCVIEIAWISRQPLPESITSFDGHWFTYSQIAELPKPILIDQDFRNRHIL